MPEISIRGLEMPESPIRKLAPLAAEAKSRGLYACMITDAGRTEVEPGTNTCVGIGPAPGSEIDRVTGGLKMLRSRSACQCGCRRHTRARPHPRGSAGARLSAGQWT